MTQEIETDEFYAALARCQGEIPDVIRNAEIKHGQNVMMEYATLDEILRTIRPVLAKHGFSIWFDTGHNYEHNLINVMCNLCHASGEQRTSEIALPADTSGSKNIVQALGSTLTYARRYLISMMLGISTIADDDAQAAAVEYIDEKTAAEIQGLCETNGIDQKTILTKLKIKSFSEITSDQYSSVMRRLKEKIEKMQAEK